MSSPDIVSTGKSSEKEKFSFTKEADGVSKTVRGEEVENGWLVTVEKSWEEARGDGGSDYKHNTWKYISPKDPREIIKEQQQPKKPIIDTNEATEMLKSVSASEGLILFLSTGSWKKSIRMKDMTMNLIGGTHSNGPVKP